MNSKKGTILIIDDELAIRESIITLLEKKSYTVLSAISAKKAMDMLLSLDQLPDLIISDINMPAENGYEFFQKLTMKPRFTRIPFIFLTGRTKKEDIRYAKYLGVDDYITKPFNSADILAVIQGKLNRRKRTIELDGAISSLRSGIPDQNIKTQEGVLFLVVWDKKRGSVVKQLYPTGVFAPGYIDELGNQLFSIASVLFGPQFQVEPEGVLLDLKVIGNAAFVYFDTTSTNQTTLRSSIFMIAYISPIISYLESIIIKSIFRQVSDSLKTGLDWDIEGTFNKLKKEFRLMK